MKKKIVTLKTQKPLIFWESGRIWFSAQAERQFYFVLTMAMLGAGILYKIGVL